MALAREPAEPGGTGRLLGTPRPPLLHRVTARQLQGLDLAIAAILVLAIGVHSMRLAGAPGISQPRLETMVLWLAAAAAIAWRRRNAVGALALMAVAAIVGVAASGAGTTPPDVLIALPMFQVAATIARRQSFPALAVTVVTFAVLSVASGGRGHSPLAEAAIIAVASWFVGDSVRVRRVYVAGLAEQAAQRQREALERAQRSLAEERLQIARELHDVVAHSLSVITIQSGVGRHVIDANPAEAKRALGAVEETSRAALDELRRMLGVLRGGEPGRAELAPAPGVAALGRLAEQVSAAGIPVELDMRSELARSLSPGAELSVYRIVQEALTNVVKHAGPATAHVRLSDEGGELVLEVLDDGLGAGVLAPYPGPAAGAAGVAAGGAAAAAAGVAAAAGGAADGALAGASGHHGLVGMRERVALFGGSLSAGPRPEGGFRVLARFPAARVSAA